MKYLYIIKLFFKKKQIIKLITIRFFSMHVFITRLNFEIKDSQVNFNIKNQLPVKNK